MVPTLFRENVLNFCKISDMNTQILNEIPDNIRLIIVSYLAPEDELNPRDCNEKNDTGQKKADIKRSTILVQ